MQWVEPELVAQVRFVEWTAEGLLRLVSSPRSLTQVIVEIASNLALTAGDAPTEGPPVGRQMRPTTHLRLEAEWKQGETAMAKARRKSPTSSTKSETTRKRAKPRRRGGPPDAIELLKQEHRNIEAWFAEFEKA